MSRLRFGLDTELDAQQLALATQTNDHNICEKMSPYMVKIKMKNPDGSIASCGSGFRAINTTHALVTSAHVVLPESKELLVYYPDDGSRGQAKLITKDRETDVALVKADRYCNLPTLRFRTASTGDTVYILGFSEASNDLSFAKGVVSSLHQGGFATTAFADNGFSGAPVFSIHMELLGMVVRGGAGCTQGLANQQVSCVNVDAINGFVGALRAVIPDMDKWP